MAIGREIRWRNRAPDGSSCRLEEDADRFFAHGGTIGHEASALDIEEQPHAVHAHIHGYRERELEDIVRAAGALDGKAERVHVAMNSNRGDYPAMNGLALKQMLLEDWRPPDRDALVAELNARRAKGRQAKPTRRAA